MKSIICYLSLFVSLSCICGMCNKGDDTPDDNGNTVNNGNNDEPKLDPDATWLYFDDAPALVDSYPDNDRNHFKKWLATKIYAAYSGLDTTANKRYLSWGFQNTGDTRFLPDSFNPGGKEEMSILINGFSNTPEPGTYTGFSCWYYVYTSSGTNRDSIMLADTDTLNITKMAFFQSGGATENRYKMSGKAVFYITYWQTGPSAELYPIHCTFNNVIINFSK